MIVDHLAPRLWPDSVSKIRGLDPLAEHLGTTASTLDTMEDS
jgi:hypothetical protein